MRQRHKVIVNDEGYKEFEHRYIWRKNNGEIPKGYMIHHKNGQVHDNRIENLELCKDRIEHGKKHRELNAMKKK